MALLAAALHASLIAGAVLGIFFLCSHTAAPPLVSVFAIGLGAMGAHVILTILYASKWPKTDNSTLLNKGGDLSGFIVIPILTTLIPLLMGLRKVGRYERACKKQKKQLIEDCSRWKMFFTLAKHKHKSLESTIRPKLDNAERSTREHPELKHDLSDPQIYQEYKNILDELKQAEEYFIILVFNHQLDRFVRDERLRPTRSVEVLQQTDDCHKR
ncbi:MAG: hypothetical protein KR126chlam2_00725 [Chlamydiae bacterium]|nr:hypothetical protein [Chlamydiota bacterium]